MLEYFGLGNGTRVSNSSIASMPAVWYALQKISGDLGKMPLEPRITKPDGRGSDPYSKHNTWTLLRDQPNSYQTPDVFKELVQMHALSWGNGRAAIIRNGTRPVELIPMMPDRSETWMVEGQKYHVSCPEVDDPLRFQGIVNETLETGRIPQDMIVLHDRDVLHIVGLGFDGVKGLNIAKVFQDALGTGLSGHRLMVNQMKKGFTGRVMLTDTGAAFKGKDPEGDAEKFLKNFRERFTNEKDGEVAGMLRQGMTAEVLSMSNADAQLIQQMSFSRQDVMLIFGLQHIPGDSSATSYNSLEQKKLDQLESTNDRWMTRWELQCDMKLRTPSEKSAGRIYYKFNAGSRLRTDIQTTANVLATLVRSQIINPNEAREKIEMNPYEGGDEFINPAISTAEPVDDQRSDRARNKLQELIKVEAKRIIEIVGKKSLKDSDQAIQEFYAKWKVTLSKAETGIDVDSYISNRLSEIGTIAAASKTVAEFRQSINNQLAKWSADDVF
jgi:HK97 family phage portal protein